MNNCSKCKWREEEGFQPCPEHDDKKPVYKSQYGRCECIACIGSADPIHYQVCGACKCKIEYDGMCGCDRRGLLKKKLNDILR